MHASSGMTFSSLKTSRMATHSKIELLAITKKLRLSALENRPDPSAMFSTMLNEARLSWSLVVMSSLAVLFINSLISALNCLAFL